MPRQHPIADAAVPMDIAAGLSDAKSVVHAPAPESQSSPDATILPFDGRTLPEDATLFVVDTTVGAGTTGARRLFRAHFDDQKLPGNTEVLDTDGYSFVKGPNGRGYALKLSSKTACISSDGNEDARMRWTDPPSVWPTKEIYFSVWYRIVKSGPDCNAPVGWKQFYPRWTTEKGTEYLACPQNSCKAQTPTQTGKYDHHSADWDRLVNEAPWSRWEYYYNFDTSRVRVWVTFFGEKRKQLDDTVLHDNNSNRMIHGKTIKFGAIGFPAIKTHCQVDCSKSGPFDGCAEKPGHAPCTFYRVIDEFEVWDGLPAGA